MPREPENSRLPRAFTVVEMMVVVAIMTLLVSIALPSLDKSKRSARMGKCLATLDQLASGVHAYAVDYFDRMPPYDNVGGLKEQTFWMTVFAPYHKDNRIRLCPETREDPTLWWGTSQIAWGAAGNAGGFIGKHTGSYGWNSWMHYGTTSGASAGYFKRLDAPKRPGDTPIFADSSWVDFWPNSTDAPPMSIGLGSQAGESSMGRVTLNRHHDLIGLAMADSSARSVKLPELWSTLYWHTTYVPAAAPPLPTN